MPCESGCTLTVANEMDHLLLLLLLASTRVKKEEKELYKIKDHYLQLQCKGMFSMFGSQKNVIFADCNTAPALKSPALPFIC